MRKRVGIGILSFILFVMLILGVYFRNITNTNATSHIDYIKNSNTSWSVYGVEDDNYNYIEAVFYAENFDSFSVNVDPSWLIVDEKIINQHDIPIFNDETGEVIRRLHSQVIKYTLVRISDEIDKYRMKTIINVSCKNTLNNSQIKSTMNPGDKLKLEKVNLNNYNYSLVSKQNDKVITSVKKNEEFLYELNFTGNNYYNNKRVVVTDIIPDGLEIIDSDGATVNGQTLTWDLGIPKTDEYSKTINIRVKAKEAGEYTNTATIAIGTDEQKIENKINVYCSDIALTVNKSVNEATVGDVITYDLVLNNNGNITSEDITVNLKLDEDLTFLNSNTQMTERNGKYYFSLGKLAAGANQTITIRVQLSRDASERELLSTVNVTEEGKTPIANNIITKSLKPNLSLSVSSDKSIIRKNELLKIMVKIKNTGTGIAKNVDLTYTIDNDLIVESIEGNTNIANLSKNEEAVITFNLKSQKNVNMKKTSNIFTITSDNAPSVNNNLSVDISDSNLEIIKNVSKNNQIGNNVIKPNEDFYYIIKVKNTGKLNAENVVYKEPINSNIDFINGIASKNNENLNGIIDETGMTFNLGTIKPNEEYSIAVSLKLKNNVNVNDIIEVFGTLSENEKDDKSIKNNIIVSNNDLYVYVTKSTEEVGTNEKITLFYNIVNDGDLNAKDVNIQTILPDELEHISNTFSNNELTIENNIINVLISEVQKNSVVQYSLTLKAVNNIRNNDVLNVKNTLTIDDKSFEYTTPIKTIASDVKIEVKTNLKELKINDEILLNIILSNKGNKKASSLKVTYKIDNNLEIIDADGGQINNNVITWKYDTLDSLASKEINVRIKVLEKSETYTNILYLAEEGKKTIENNTSFIYKEEITNPKTGTFINLLSLIIFFIIGLMIILKSKRKNIMNKI